MQRQTSVRLSGVLSNPDRPASTVERRYTSIEFEAEVNPDGTLRVPRGVVKQLRRRERVIIRLTRGRIPAALRLRNITEEEIEEIASRQLEQREDVIRFLQGEGQLSVDRSFARRAVALLKRRI